MIYYAINIMKVLNLLESDKLYALIKPPRSKIRIYYKCELLTIKNLLSYNIETHNESCKNKNYVLRLLYHSKVPLLAILISILKDYLQCRIT